jgi:hypothetical protein
MRWNAVWLSREQSDPAEPLQRAMAPCNLRPLAFSQGLSIVGLL